ncbi:hypothetical protein QAD02_004237 [Eretmocerus hayati]|uniref:Uncharacterized protein n=1 Tax=Eretmocerus hayati TaxID=131215 RepID=A0ACC2NQ03_9HYME|nr:hypothetical protein QAD02_004237 [Eretmocerus hayati]
MDILGSSSKSSLVTSITEEIKDREPPKKVHDPGGVWKCCHCRLEEHYDYKGNKPPFAKHLSFSEDCYIMKDPFSSLNRGEILILGGDCSICNRSVCLECSLFYAKRFCKACAFENSRYFPSEVQKKIHVLNKENKADE